MRETSMTETEQPTMTTGPSDRMAHVHLARIEEMPRIELYLDQVLSLVSGELSFMTLPGEVVLTGSMVNNYVKQRIVPAPVRRRYTRRHVASLIFVCALKRVFSIAEVGALHRELVQGGVDVARAYDDLCAAVERALAQRFSREGPRSPIEEVRLYDAAGSELDGNLARALTAAVEAVADKVYVEQSLL